MTSWLKVAAPMVLLSIDDFSIEILGLFTQNEADWTASFNSQLKGTFINDITNHSGLEMGLAFLKSSPRSPYLA